LSSALRRESNAGDAARGLIVDSAFALASDAEGPGSISSSILGAARRLRLGGIVFDTSERGLQVSVALRRALFPVRLALVRLRGRAAPAALVAVGIAAGAAFLAVSLAASVIVQDRALGRALASLPPGERSVRASWSGLPLQASQSLRQLDHEARVALGTATGREPLAAMVFRSARFGGPLVDLGGVEDLDRRVELASGRLPRTCTPRRCEVLQVAGEHARLRPPVVVVGTAVLRSGQGLGTLFVRQTHPVLVADGIFGVSRLREGELIARTYAWSVPLDRASLHAWDVDGFLARVDRAGAELETRSTIFGVSAPVDELRSLAAASRVSARRLLVVGGESAALVLAFTLLAATRLRRDAEAAWRRLTWFGAGRWQLVTLSAAESGATAALAAVAGWILGAAIAAALAAHVDLPVWAVLRQSVVSGRGVLLALALAAVAAAVVLGSLRARIPGFGGLTVNVADVAAVGALAAIALAFARGDTDASSLAGSGGTAAVLLLLPALVMLVAGVAASRLLSPALRLLERLGRSAGPSFRLAALSLARARGAAVAAVVFLVVTVGLATFAATYRATLVANQRDEAGFAVPADFILRENDRRLVTVQRAAPPSAYAALGHAALVLRTSGNLTGVGDKTAFTLLGLPRGAIERLHGWRDDFAPGSRVRLARRLAPPTPVREHGVELPADARALALDVDLRGTPLALAVAIHARRGDFITLTFDPVGRGRHLLRAKLPPAARGGRIVGLTLALPTIEAFLAGHAESGRTTAVSDNSSGVLTFRRLAASTPHAAVALRPAFGSWIGVDGIKVISPGRVRYVVNRSTASRYRPAQPTDGYALPVIATPELAAAAGAGGVLPIAVEDEPLTARVVATADLFPGARANAVVADAATVENALNSVFPGLGVPNEAWIWAEPSAEARLRHPPFASLDLTSRRAVEAALRANPLAHGSLLLLGAASVAALLLALAGLTLVVVSDLRDGHAELFDLETQGLGPAALRRHIRLRALLVVAVGTLAGLATGAVLSALVVDTVAVTANAAEPLPPLRLAVDWLSLGLGLLAFAAVAVALVFLVTAWWFREATPTRAAEAAA
jgi:hypothetical protein